MQHFTVQTPQLKMLTQAHQIPHIVGKGGGAYLRQSKGGENKIQTGSFCAAMKS